MPTIRTRTLLIPLLVLLTTVLAGCFETTLNLGSADNAKVNVKYCGDWHFAAEGGGDTADLTVRNFDGKQYYVEWLDNEKKRSRMSAFMVKIKDADFAQLTELADDGSLQSKHLILRAQLDGDKLTLRNLKEDFFAGVTTDEQLRKRVEENLDNAAMYEDTMTGTRAAVQ
jgi:hypothetical protein